MAAVRHRALTLARRHPETAAGRDPPGRKGLSAMAAMGSRAPRRPAMPVTAGEVCKALAGRRDPLGRKGLLARRALLARKDSPVRLAGGRPKRMGGAGGMRLVLAGTRIRGGATM